MKIDAAVGGDLKEVASTADEIEPCGSHCLMTAELANDPLFLGVGWSGGLM